MYTVHCTVYTLYIINWIYVKAYGISYTWPSLLSSHPVTILHLRMRTAMPTHMHTVCELLTRYPHHGLRNPSDEHPVNMGGR